MVAKKQIMNVKSECKILMNQADSDFVFNSTLSPLETISIFSWSISTAAIVPLWLRPLVTSPKVAEVFMGLEYLHSTGVVHCLLGQ
ncbi:protein-serine/threonine kinase [Puccinia sorghi]|uniref:Protein-serine/threonine kinase n=1 Tax=Puccinia sorghi TaxID=27349 RepID=A0A0L6UUT6_9BASI|nr:protein-serine/threonine kinase [Puccinia sorghi]